MKKFGEFVAVDAEAGAQRGRSCVVAGRADARDGRRIAFAGFSGIHVMNADGSGQRNLTRSPWHESSASGRRGRVRPSHTDPMIRSSLLLFALAVALGAAAGNTTGAPATASAAPRNVIVDDRHGRL
jgi:hypothetical protein